ncbi:2-hydroxyacyl-CoA dehydratase subunit D [Clostridium ganghwense]|uniref:2-hydroxyacyl-CoA dehydratase family protein n=1 Tax=Clostridium ganghwense TaxID=312089 RepID=A0ABT4CT35_9CLOT|nr:2-hydroxyacyl-CoA dehydratase family protein [Clostridium ganghwense]MCY6371206.1 2-hydroxyacyl-CoA dehydratase family protein [Clostridium ganghwense]
MDIIKKYGYAIKNSMANPETSLNLIKTGLFFEKFRLSKFRNKTLPPSLQYLNKICVQYILEPLQNSHSSALVNLFAPAELLHAMNIYPLFIEAFSSFLSGFTCEDYFIDYATNCGFSETLCSYHKAFLGAINSGLLPKPRFAITSSMICDANISTFKHTSKQYDIPLYVIDIPYEYSKDAEKYVSVQIKEMVNMMEDVMKKSLDENKLKEVIMRENASLIYRKNFYTSLQTKYFPNTLTLEMYKLFASHVAIGREETYTFYKMQAKDIKTFKESKSKKILWVHLLPFYHKLLKNYFNLSEDYQLLTCDFNFDYMDELDYNHPYDALAKKMILNQYNGSFETKAQNILKAAKTLNADGVINFCHWGCKQSTGGTMILKELFKKNNLPFLSIDGDCIDRRNTQDGQIQTRIEAFLEMINTNNRRKVV